MAKKVSVKRKLTVKNLGWKLMEGSHEFPGPDGGTCINEAAIIARGFEYRTVDGVKDMPPCFSPVISMFALHINDKIYYDDYRTKLLAPFITQLAGTSDAKAEAKRARYMMEQAHLFNFEKPEDEDIYNALFEQQIGLPFVKRHEKAIALFKEAQKDNYRKLALEDISHITKFGHKDAEDAVTALEDRHSDETKWGPEAVRILGDMIKMGKHAKVADLNKIKKRLADYKKQAKNRDD